jgi:hypothetical protein
MRDFLTKVHSVASAERETTMSSETTFAGILIEGDRSRYTRQLVPQRPKEELVPIMLDVLNDERVKFILWIQYTPYFNDGEPCEFGVGDFGIVMDGVDYSEVLGSYGYDENQDLTSLYPDELTTWYELKDEDPLKEKLKTLAKTSGPFEDAYYELFGDHARVIATREKFTIDEYEHD